MSKSRPLNSPGDETRPLSDRVIAAIAEKEDISPLDIETPLYEVLDPDALDALFVEEHADLTVTFSYYGYDVTVSSDEQITLANQNR